MKEKEFPTNPKNLILLNGEDSEEVKKAHQEKSKPAELTRKSEEEKHHIKRNGKK